MDDNRSKTLDLEEFRKGLQEAGVPLEQGDVEEVFSLCDKNKSGMLDFDEFLEALRVSRAPWEEIEYCSLFKQVASSKYFSSASL